MLIFVICFTLENYSIIFTSNSTLMSLHAWLSLQHQNDVMVIFFFSHPHRYTHQNYFQTLLLFFTFLFSLSNNDNNSHELSPSLDREHITYEIFCLSEILRIYNVMTNDDNFWFLSLPIISYISRNFSGCENCRSFSLNSNSLLYFCTETSEQRENGNVKRGKSYS